MVEAGSDTCNLLLLVAVVLIMVILKVVVLMVVVLMVVVLKMKILMAEVLMVECLKMKILMVVQEVEHLEVVHWVVELLYQTPILTTSVKSLLN